MTTTTISHAIAHIAATNEPWWFNPAWWQALLSALAIVASGMIAASVPAIDRYLGWRERQADRFNIVCTREVTGSLEIVINYTPARRHQALDCKVRLLEPSGGATIDMSGRDLVEARLEVEVVTSHHTRRLARIED